MIQLLFKIKRKLRNFNFLLFVIVFIAINYTYTSNFFGIKSLIEGFPDSDESNPDDWGEGEVLLPYDPKDRKRQREWPKRERRRKKWKKIQEERERQRQKEEEERERKRKEQRRRDHLGDPDNWGPGAGPIIL